MNFLNSFKVAAIPAVRQSIPSTGRQGAVESPTSSDFDSDTEHGSNKSSDVESLDQPRRRASDARLREGSISTPISETDWACPYTCEKKICASQYGFLMFVVDLRKHFWGSSGMKAPSSKERKNRIKNELLKIHKGGSVFIFGYSVAIQGRGTFVEICESAFFKALGSGKTSQWIRAMNVCKRGECVSNKIGRPKFKTEKVVAFITLFLTKCDMPPSRGMQHIKILPFPNVSHFYQEYCSTFKAPYLALLSEEQATR
jgi:hypothetical protein